MSSRWIAVALATISIDLSTADAKLVGEEPGDWVGILVCALSTDSYTGAAYLPYGDGL